MSTKDLFRSVLKLPVIESCWYHLVKNRTYGSWWTKLTPNHYSYHSSSIRKVKRNGVNYELTLSDIVDWSIYFGFKETEKEKLFCLDPNPVSVIDVGANIGEVSFRFANKYLSAQIFSFEPHPVTFKKLQDNYNRNTFDNVTLLNLGLGSKQGEVHFEDREAGNLGMNRVTANPEKAAHRITITTLDSFIQENALSSVSVIKIDVEGYEHEVLKGASHLLATLKPDLFIELDDDNLTEQGSSASELVKYIQSFGYRIEHAEKGTAIDENNNLKKTHFDIICKATL